MQAKVFRASLVSSQLSPLQSRERGPAYVGEQGQDAGDGDEAEALVPLPAQRGFVYYLVSTPKL